jgi:glycosyltransferase involved in cell wall biosynthesis
VSALGEYTERVATLRIALLSYRSKPHCGGQGIYVRHLSRELVNLGHSVEVFSGQPYPELDPGVTLTKVPSLDLYREPDPFRIPKPREFRDLVDVEEFLTMCTAGFPEPKTFSTRVARLLRERVDEFDIVHDNQVLGYGMLEIEKMGLPLITTIHHPITFDRRIDIANAPWRKKLSVRRWYGFLRMQGKVARQARHILTPSESSRRDIAEDFGVDPARMQTILLGVDEGFVPPREVPGGRTEKLIDKLSIGDSVRFVHGVSDAQLVDLMGSAEVACVPSLYEGFSLPTAELMACETPLVVSRAGAIPEVVGPDGLCADLVTPGDVFELEAAIAALLDDPDRRAEMGRAGRQRVQELFSWRAVAAAVAEAYENVITDYRASTGPSTIASEGE